MKSLIYEYIDQERENKVSISNYKQYQNKIKNEIIQVIRQVSINHTEEERYHIRGLTEQELYWVLIYYLSDRRFVEYPS